MVDEHGMSGHTTIQPEQYHPIAWLCYTWVVTIINHNHRGIAAQAKLGLLGSRAQERPLFLYTTPPFLSV